MERKYSEWTKESLQAMFGEGYVVIGGSRSIYGGSMRDFTVLKTGTEIQVSYSKHMKDITTKEDFVIGIASVSCVAHRIKCYGSTHLKTVDSDEEIVKQAKRVLEW